MKMGGHGDAAATSGYWMAPDEAAKRPNPVKADKASVARGKKLFETNCASCHGSSGKSDGPAGTALNPKLADLMAMAGQAPPPTLIAAARGADSDRAARGQALYQQHYAACTAPGSSSQRWLCHED